jgi:hypothetical protein
MTENRETELVEPAVRLRMRAGKLAILEVDGEVEPVTSNEVRAGLEGQRLEREDRWS